MLNSRYVNSIIVAGALCSLILLGLTSAYAQNEKFRAKLEGNNLVPPVDTPAEGIINFKTKGDTITWKSNITGITDATGARIHQGTATEKGEVIADLLKASKHSDRPGGMTLRGNITDSSLLGPMQGKTLDDFKTAMGSGNTFITIDTADHPDGLIGGLIKIKGSNETTTSAPTNND